MTITLPSSRSDFVALALSAALAGGVLFAPYPSTAQTTIDPERASHELKRIEADLAGGRSTKAQLDRLAADLDREITRLRAEMAEATSRHQRTEETVTEVEATLSVLRHEAGEKHVPGWRQCERMTATTANSNLEVLHKASYGYPDPDMPCRLVPIPTP